MEVGVQSEPIPHIPRRGLILIPPTADVVRTVTIAERKALVTYHKAPVVLWQGRCHVDLSACLATWVDGNGSDDFPPGNGGGHPVTMRIAA
jgi:hypothetical protein